MKKNIFKGKKVIVTGHTGFKGSWLALWLDMMGAKVVGISINIPTNPSNFKATKIQNRIIHTLKYQLKIKFVKTYISLIFVYLITITHPQLVITKI